MQIGLVDSVRFVAAMVVGGVSLDEVIGYLWHRFFEHKGVFSLGSPLKYNVGDKIRLRHYDHHLEVYPVEKIRRPPEYISSKSWSWYVLAAIVSIVVLSASFALGHFADGIAVVLGGALYGHFVVNYLHEAFHIIGHPLERYRWFRRLRLYHDIHHLVNGNYGIAFMVMDRFFGTFVPNFPSPRREENLFPGLGVARAGFTSRRPRL